MKNYIPSPFSVGKKLKGADLDHFADRRAEIDALRGTGPSIAQAVKAD